MTVQTMAVESPKRLQNVFVVARDPAAQHAFYESALGLKLKFRDGDRWLQYGVGENNAFGNVAIASLAESQPATSGLVMVFEVDDFAAIAARVGASGGSVLGTRDMGSHGEVMSLRDPEGNVVQLFKRRSASA